LGKWQDEKNKIQIGIGRKENVSFINHFLLWQSSKMSKNHWNTKFKSIRGVYDKYKPGKSNHQIVPTGISQINALPFHLL
jgi:hypothetical protein